MHLVVFFLVFAAGGAINNENAVTKVTDFKGFTAAVERSIDERKPYDSGSLKKSKTGDFGND